jgi:CBS domain-containing protein
MEVILDAGDIMTRNVFTVPPDMAVPDVARLLFDHQISAVPVIDSEGRLVGILNEGDLLGRPPLKRTKGSWLLFFEGDSFLESLAAARDFKVTDLMVRDVITVTEHTPVDFVASLLHRHKVKSVPVLNGGKLVGIISRIDVLGALVDYRAASPRDDRLRT